MELMQVAAAHDILVISDSDVRVTPDDLRAVALPFADGRVGGITCPYRGEAVDGGCGPGLRPWNERGDDGRVRRRE